MANITVQFNVCSRIFRGKTERFKVKVQSLNDAVKKLKENTADVVSLPKQDFDIIYCGKKLDESKSLKDYDLRNGSTVFLFPSLKEEKNEPLENIEDHELNQLVQTLQSALLNPAYRSTVERVLNTGETLESIIAATPGLDKDPVALAMLQDQELLAILAHPANIKQIVKKHPAFVHAATVVGSIVSEEGEKNDSEHTATGMYSMDRLSDDEESPNQPAAGSSGSLQGGGNLAQQGITASQLSAALAMATGGTPFPNQTNMMSSSGGATGGSIITQDFFQQALNQASGRGSQAQSQVGQEQITQLREMGITDEDLARRALQATGGDLQAALDLIFGDGHF